MKYGIGLFIMALILVGAPFLSNQEVPSIIFLFIGLILLMTLTIIAYIHTTFSDEHRALLMISVVFCMTVLFTPCLAVFNFYSESITDWTLVRYVATFSLVPIIWGGSIILSYRYYFIRR